jgi:hypothetical protein
MVINWCHTGGKEICSYYRWSQEASPLSPWNCCSTVTISLIFLLFHISSLWNPNCNFLSLTVKSESTKRALSFWSASCHSSALFVKSLKTSRYCYWFKWFNWFYLSNLCTWWLIFTCLFVLADWFEVPEPRCARTSGGCRGLSCRSVWGHQLVCYSC